MDRASHPGSITFVERNGSERIVPIEQVPDSLVFVRMGGGASAPVVRVVAAERGDSREIRCYGTDGRLLLTTFQRLQLA